MIDRTTITGRIDRALHRMMAEGFHPTSITLGQAEQTAMVDWLRWTLSGFPAEAKKTLRDQLPGMKYRGVQLACVDEPERLRVEGIWVDQICEGPPEIQ